MKNNLVHVNGIRLGTGLALAAALALGPALLAAGSDPKPAAPQAAAPATGANGPKLLLTEDKKDVGVVPKGETIRQTFVLKNVGKADLHITDVKPSCGCTVPEFDKVIKPGGEGKVTLNVETKAFQGAISKTALIVTDDPTQPQVTVFVTATVKPYVETLPYGFFRIQALTGETASSELVLVSDEADFKPTKAEVTQSYLKVSMAPVQEKERVAGKNSNQYKLVLTANPDAPEGLLGGYVKVATGVKKQPELDLAISGYIKPTVSFTPGNINFGNFDPKGDVVRRKVVLVNNNARNDKFQVLKAETNVPGISVEVKPIENDKMRVEVVLTVDQKIKKGVIDGELAIKTNDTSRADIKVPLKGVIL